MCGWASTCGCTNYVDTSDAQCLGKNEGMEYGGRCARGKGRTSLTNVVLGKRGCAKLHGW